MNWFYLVLFYSLTEIAIGVISAVKVLAPGDQIYSNDYFFLFIDVLTQIISVPTFLFTGLHSINKYEFVSEKKLGIVLLALGFIFGLMFKLLVVFTFFINNISYNIYMYLQCIFWVLMFVVDIFFFYYIKLLFDLRKEEKLSEKMKNI